LIIAGGLRPSNVATVIHQLRPYGVDVSSGVESERGVKSHALMQEFVDTVRDLERE
jgi:phosphoribosylanthranilate isomerase